VSSLLDGFQIVGVGLNLLLVILLLRGYFREYSILFFFNLIQPLIAIVELYMTFSGVSRKAPLYADVYWTCEVIWDLLLFILVAVLIEKVVEGDAQRALSRRILVIVAAAAVILPFLLYFNRETFSTKWFQGASQLYNLGAALLNLVLWGALIAARNRTHQLLMVCAGLGINVTGAAIQWGIRQLAHDVVEIRNLADVFAGLTYLMGLAIWCWAFRQRKKENSPADPLATP
jgi:hypothetical protein